MQQAGIPPEQSRVVSHLEGTMTLFIKKMLSIREFAMFGSSFVIGIGHRQRECVVDELGSAAKAVPHGWVTLSGTLKPSKGLFTSSFWI